MPTLVQIMEEVSDHYPQANAQWVIMLNFFITINKFIITLTKLYIDSYPHKFSIIILSNILSMLTHLSIRYANACYDALSLYDYNG